MMGRFGLVSLGHGGFMGVGAYVTALLWNHLGVSPWLGIPLAHAGCRGAGPGGRLSLLSLPHHRALFCSGHAGAVRHRAAGHHRDARLDRRLAGLHARRTKGSVLVALQFDDKTTWYLIALGVWAAVCDLALGRPQHGSLCPGGDLRGRGCRGRGRRQRNREKLKITVISAVMTALRRRALLPVPDVHLARHGERHFGLAADGVRRHGRRDLRGAWADGRRRHHHPAGRSTAHRLWHQGGRLGQPVYGVLLVVFIIFLPKGILGSILDAIKAWR